MAENGSDSPTNIGIGIRPLTPEDARALQIPTDTKGLLIVNVASGSPAADAGLRSGDVILSANLTPVTSTDELASVLKKEGKERGAVMFQINRRGNVFFITVSLDKEKK